MPAFAAVRGNKKGTGTRDSLLPEYFYFPAFSVIKIKLLSDCTHRKYICDKQYAYAPRKSNPDLIAYRLT